MQPKRPHRRSSEQMPAARRGQALDAGLHAADRDRSGRSEHPRTEPSRHMQRLVEPRQIRPARREADHRNAVIAAGMPCHDLVGRQVQVPGDVLEVDAVLAAIGDGDAPAPRLCRSRRRLLGQRQQFLAKRVEIDLYGIVVHQKRAIGRHRLGHTLDLCRRERAIERQHALVGGIIDIFGEFHRDGAVATRQQAGRGQGRGHGSDAVVFHAFRSTRRACHALDAEAWPRKMRSANFPDRSALFRCP